MPAPWLIASLLMAICFTSATALDSWRQNWSGHRASSKNFLELLMGDSRRLFASHFIVKADIYFHSGYYPSIFDQVQRKDLLHLEKSSHSKNESTPHADEHEEEEGSFLTEPRDWIERFGRNFFPTEHSHLEEGNEREILPWLRLAAELDPQRVETYTVGAFWLRTRLGKPAEAEKFLRQGLRENPGSFEILLALGNLRDEHNHDSRSARNLWELAFKKYMQDVQAGKNPDKLIFEQIVARLGELEEREGNFATAINYFSILRDISPAKNEIEKRINSLREKLPPK